MIISNSYVSFVGATDLYRYGAAASYQPGSSHQLIHSRLVSEAKSSFCGTSRIPHFPISPTCPPERVLRTGHLNCQSQIPFLHLRLPSPPSPPTFRPSVSYNMRIKLDSLSPEKRAAVQAFKGDITAVFNDLYEDKWDQELWDRAVGKLSSRPFPPSMIDGAARVDMEGIGSRSHTVRHRARDHLC